MVSATEVRRPKQEWNETSILKCWGTFINLEKKTEERLKYNNNNKKRVKQKLHQDNTNKTVTAAKQPLSNRYFCCTVTPVW